MSRQSWRLVQLHVATYQEGAGAHMRMIGQPVLVLGMFALVLSVSATACSALPPLPSSVMPTIAATPTLAIHAAQDSTSILPAVNTPDVPTSILPQIARPTIAEPIATAQPQDFLPSISSLSFADAYYGFLAVDTAVLATQDGGVHWKKLLTATAPIHLSFISRERGWASTDGRMLTTIDGGITWQPVASAPPDTFWVQFGDATTGWAATQTSQKTDLPPAWYRTRDAGRTWQKQPSPCGDLAPNGPLLIRPDGRHWLSCPQLGWVGLRPSKLYTSKDAGSHWQLVLDASDDTIKRTDGLPWDGFISALSFIDTQRGWAAANSYINPGAAGQYGRLLTTYDGGKTWADLPNTPQGEYVDLQFLTPDMAFLVVHTTRSTMLYRTDDGGRSWMPRYTASAGTPR